MLELIFSPPAFHRTKKTLPDLFAGKNLLYSPPKPSSHFLLSFVRVYAAYCGYVLDGINNKGK